MFFSLMQSDGGQDGGETASNAIENTYIPIHVVQYSIYCVCINVSFDHHTNMHTFSLPFIFVWTLLKHNNWILIMHIHVRNCVHSIYI